MSRLTWRQRLIAIAVGVAAAALQASIPAPKLHRTAHATPQNACAMQAQTSC